MMIASTFTNYDFRGTHDYTGAANCYRYYSAGDAVNYDDSGGGQGCSTGPITWDIRTSTPYKPRGTPTTKSLTAYDICKINNGTRQPIRKNRARSRSWSDFSCQYQPNESRDARGGLELPFHSQELQALH